MEFNRKEMEPIIEIPKRGCLAFVIAIILTTIIYVMVSCTAPPPPVYTYKWKVAVTYNNNVQDTLSFDRISKNPEDWVYVCIRVINGCPVLMLQDGLSGSYTVETFIMASHVRKFEILEYERTENQ